MVVDILEIYFVEHVKKAKSGTDVVDDYFVELCTYAMENGDVGRCQGVFERIIGHTNNKRWEISDMIAVSFRD